MQKLSDTEMVMKSKVGEFNGCELMVEGIKVLNNINS